MFGGDLATIRGCHSLLLGQLTEVRTFIKVLGVLQTSLQCVSKARLGIDLSLNQSSILYISVNRVSTWEEVRVSTTSSCSTVKSFVRSGAFLALIDSRGDGFMSSSRHLARTFVR